VPIGTPVVVAAAYTNTDLSSYPTATLSPAVIGGRVLVSFNDSSHGTLTAPLSTPTGLSVVWTNRIIQAHPTDVRRVFGDTAPCGPAPVNGAVTYTETGNTPSTGTGWAILQVAGVWGAQPIVRAVGTNANSTSVTLTLPRPLSVANRWVVFVSHRANEVTTPRAAPWAELSDVAGSTPTRGGEVQWLPGVVDANGILEVSASASWATSGQASIIALELQAIQTRSPRTGGRARLGLRRR
jgi:hypothetical protein